MHNFNNYKYLLIDLLYIQNNKSIYLYTVVLYLIQVVSTQRQILLIMSHNFYGSTASLVHMTQGTYRITTIFLVSI
jgi:hypothetical protein